MQQSTDLQLALLIFRLGTVWLALPTQFFKEASFTKQTHLLPHRSGDIILGVVNWNGILQLCVSLENLLASDLLALSDSIDSEKTESEHMLALEKNEHIWIFPADEIEGIRYFSRGFLDDLKVAKQFEYFSKVIPEDDRQIYLIDENRFFDHLTRLVI